jgi:hypothetical protein
MGGELERDNSKIERARHISEYTGADFLAVERVPYGKDDTPVDEREYKLQGHPESPVGTRKEWDEFAKSKGFKGNRYFENDGSVGFNIFQ